MIVAARARDRCQRRCPYCHGGLEDDAVACEGCRTPYHADCLRELGRCGLLGCAQAPIFTTPPRGSAWSSGAMCLAACAIVLALWTIVIPFVAGPAALVCGLAVTGPAALVCGLAALAVHDPRRRP